MSRQARGNSIFRIQPSRTTMTQVDEIVGIPEPRVCLQVTQEGAVFTHNAGIWTNIFNETDQEVLTTATQTGMGVTPEHTVTIAVAGDYYIKLIATVEIGIAAPSNEIGMRIVRTPPVLPAVIIDSNSEYYDNNDGWTMRLSGAWPLEVGDVLTFQYAPITANRPTRTMPGTSVSVFRLL